MSNNKILDSAQLEVFMRELAKLLMDCTREEALSLYCTTLARKLEMQHENEIEACAAPGLDISTIPRYNT